MSANKSPSRLARDRKRLEAHARKKKATTPVSATSLREQAMIRFVAANDLSCFNCQRDIGPWAKTGVGKSGRAWAICVPCVRSRSG